jgi:hypothetical protein
MVHAGCIGGIFDHLANICSVLYSRYSDWTLVKSKRTIDRLTGSAGELKVVHSIQSHLSSIQVLELNISRSFTLTVLFISFAPHIKGYSHDHDEDRQIQ